MFYTTRQTERWIFKQMYKISAFICIPCLKILNVMQIIDKIKYRNIVSNFSARSVKVWNYVVDLLRKEKEDIIMDYHFVMHSMNALQWDRLIHFINKKENWKKIPFKLNGIDGEAIILWYINWWHSNCCHAHFFALSLFS